MRLVTRRWVMSFVVRRVVTGHDAGGRAVFVSDGTPPRTVASPEGFGLSELLWLGGPPAGADAGGEPPEGEWVLEPPVGGASFRLIRLPAPPAGARGDDRWLRVPGDDPARPGVHATDTLDCMVVLDGHVVLGLDDGEHPVGPGDVVIQRGTAHRWRVEGDRPCTYAVLMLRADPSAPVPPVPLVPRTSPAPGPGPRRLVTGQDQAGRSCVTVDGAAPAVFRPAGPQGATMVELWQTGGRLRAADQGGDPDGPWVLEPLGRGVAFRYVELPGGHEPGLRGWHTTATIDLNLILSGRLELALPDREPLIIGPGDTVVQRATEHRWRPVGDEPVRWVAAMIALGT